MSVPEVVASSKDGVPKNSMVNQDSINHSQGFAVPSKNGHESKIPDQTAQLKEQLSHVRDQFGKEIDKAKQHLANGMGQAIELMNSEASKERVSSFKKFRRSIGNKLLGGVCGGMSEATGWSVWVFRVPFVLLNVYGVPIYCALWFFVPKSQD